MKRRLYGSLVLDVSLDLGEGCPAGGGDKVARAPEMGAPKGSADFREALAAQVAGRDAFKGIDQGGRGDLGQHGHEQVEVVGFAVHLIESAAEVSADLGKDTPKELAHAGCDRPASVLGNKDQMII